MLVTGLLGLALLGDPAGALPDQTTCLDLATRAEAAVELEPCLRSREEPLPADVVRRGVRRWLHFEGERALATLLDDSRRWDWRAPRVALDATSVVRDGALRERLAAVAVTTRPEAPHAMRALLRADPPRAWSLGLDLVSRQPAVLGHGADVRADAPARTFLRSLGEAPPPPEQRERLLALAEAHFPSQLWDDDPCSTPRDQPSTCPPVFEALRSLGEAAVPTLLRLAASPDPLRRRNALFVLRGSGEARVQSAFAAALRDPDARVRKLAIWLALDDRCDRIDDVRPLLADVDPSVRRRAARAMVECDRAAGVSVLLDLLRHEIQVDPAVRSPWEAAAELSLPVDPEHSHRNGQSVVVLLEDWAHRRTAWRQAEKAERAERIARAEKRDLDEWASWVASREHRDGDAVRARLDALEACAEHDPKACAAVDLQLVRRVGDRDALDRLEAVAANHRPSMDLWSTRYEIRRRLGLLDWAADVVDARRHVTDRSHALDLLRRERPEEIPSLVSRLIAMGDPGSLDIARQNMTTAQHHAGLVDALFRDVEASMQEASAGGSTARTRSHLAVLGSLLRPEDCARARELVARAPPEIARDARKLTSRCEAPR